MQDVNLFQRIRFSGKRSEVVWTDGYDVPLLTVDTLARFKQYKFYGRFNQNWTNLVWTNGLVKALVPLILSQEGFVEDQRSLRTLREVPHLSAGTAKKSAIASSPKETDLSSFFWWLLLLTFFIERLLTYKRAGAQL